MTNAMQALYDHVLEDRLPAFLTGQSYKTLDDLVSKHLSALRQELSSPQKERLDKLTDALWEQRDLELSAMFQAAWTAARELA